MDRSDIQLILNHLNLSEDCVANIYHHGSWVYGTNKPNSDRDIFIITRSFYQNPLQFWTDFDYFHQHEVYKLLDKYDVCIYSIENFEILLENSYLMAVQCVFLPDEYKIKEDIDFRQIYLDKYYDILGLKRAAFYEMYRDIKLYNPKTNSDDPLHNSMPNEHRQSRRKHVLKNLFHGIRYLDFVDQLIQTKSIYDYKRVTYIFNQMKEILGDPGDQSSMKCVVEFVRAKSDEFKSRLDTLVPTDNITDTFEAQITFDCTQNPEQVIEKLKRACENTKYNLLLIQLDTKQGNKRLQQFMTSSFHCGEYPSIVQQIKEEAHQHFQEFNIIRIKIKSSTSNECIPQKDIDMKLFWNKGRNYFEFNYHLSLKNDPQGEQLKKLINKCQSNYRLNSQVSFNVIKQINEKNFHHRITMDLFRVGRKRAFEINDEIVEYSTRNDFPSPEITYGFVLYDSLSELNQS
ncbi:unnamed protein product [Rotaria sordida]|uniref:Polymerase nucleotidyl transferase domain-containing protein n=1 Tax=Rotaria sordida TaxID=392033 RepID=A0A815FCX6_9BILA|nr:unnamed protein product [Rotaria sordida]CAF3869125.1 unnamed protein product [Rotaria sordida]